jgi:uncharacterized membrane protein
VTIERGPQRRPAFQREIRHAVRYEQGLVIKLVAVLVVVAVVIVVRTLYFA